MPAKSKKGKTVGLTEFLREDEGPMPPSGTSWADDVPEDHPQDFPEERAGGERGEKKERTKAGSWGSGNAFGGGGDWRSGPATGQAAAGGGGGGASSGYRSNNAGQNNAIKFPENPPFQAYVGSLSYEVTEEDLRNYFTDVKEVRVVRNNADGKSKGFAYVDFTSVDGLKAAVGKDGASLKGRNIRVDVNKDSGRDGGKGGQGGFNALSEDWRGSMGSGLRDKPASPMMGGGGAAPSGKGGKGERGMGMGMGNRGGPPADFSRASFGGSVRQEPERVERPAREAPSRPVPEFNRDLVGSELRAKPTPPPTTNRFADREREPAKPAPTFSRDEMGGVLEAERKKAEEQRVAAEKKKEEERAARRQMFSAAVPSRDMFGGGQQQQAPAPQQAQPQQQTEEVAKAAETEAQEAPAAAQAQEAPAQVEDEEAETGGWADEEVDFQEAAAQQAEIDRVEAEATAEREKMLAERKRAEEKPKKKQKAQPDKDGWIKAETQDDKKKKQQGQAAPAQEKKPKKKEPANVYAMLGGRR